MSTGDYLSNAQFGDVNTTPPATPEPIRAPINEPGTGPLSYSAKTNSSSKQAAVWRKPPGLSYSSATSGSVFDPYSN
jgi:hypothetical protein